jgi:hypothetical protein
MGDAAIQRNPNEMRDILGQVRNDGNAELWVRTLRGLGVGFVARDAALVLPFDGDVPHETMSALVNLFGHQLQRPSVATGGIIGRPGQFQKAVQCAEATTNLCTDPVMGVLWGSYGTPVVRELSTTWAKFGTSSLHVQGDSGGDGAASGVGTLTSGVTYTLSCWAKVVSGSATLSVVRAGAPYTVYATRTLGSGPDETWRATTFTMPETVACNLVFFTGAGEGYLDGVQLEQKAYPTPLCAGDLGPGHAWTGTAHASTSTRTNALLRYPLQMYTPAAGTISLWVSRCWSDLTSNAERLCDSNVANGPIMYVAVGPPSFQFNMCGTGAVGGDPSAYADWEWVHAVLTWDATTVRGYVNGEEFASGAIVTACPTLTQLQIGNRADGLRPWNGYLDDVGVWTRCLTAPEVRAIYEAGLNGIPLLGGNTVPGDWRPVVIASRATAQTINNATNTVVDYDTVTADTAGGVVTGASWAYTVRRAGEYHVSAGLAYVTAGAFVDGEEAWLGIAINGTLAWILNSTMNVPAAATYLYLYGSRSVAVAVGDTISIMTRQASGAARTLLNDARFNYVTIEWIG